MRISQIAAVAGVLALAAAAPAALINGGFEDGTATGEWVVPDGWTVSDPVGYYHHYTNDPFGQPEGDSFFYLYQGHIEQEVGAIVEGNLYTLSWWTSTLVGLSSRAELWDATAGQMLASSADVATNDAWAEQSLEWVGTAETAGHTLAVRLVASGARLDAVSLLVPEPTSLTLLGLVGGAALLRRRNA